MSYTCKEGGRGNLLDKEEESQEMSNSYGEYNSNLPPQPLKVWDPDLKRS